MVSYVCFIMVESTNETTTTASSSGISGDAPSTSTINNNNDDSRQRAMERLRAARMRLARSGAQTRVNYNRKNVSEKQTNVTPTTPTTTTTLSTTPTTAVTEEVITVNNKRSLEIDNSTITGPSTPAKISKTGTSSSSSIENSRKEASTTNVTVTPPNNISPNQQQQHRNATNINNNNNNNNNSPLLSKKIDKYIEYDFSKMKDTRAGFIQDNGGLTDQEVLEQQEKELELKKREAMLSEPPMIPGIDPNFKLQCFECGAENLDFKLYNVFKSRVCKVCRREKPEKYSLLTKTECREDYLLTEPELRDTELLPHLERPNPHKTTFNNMMLYLRYQVEEFAMKKWGGEEGLDAEYERRVEMRKQKKDKKFIQKLKELRRRTRAAGGGGGGVDSGGRGGERRHVHEWSAGVEVVNAEIAGTVRRRCAGCGMTTEEVLLL